ncbi:unnamed protein product [Hymenolepis diminuta]|uniref:Uncharacterized protein n=1 Tax=Hymenolepis diminuta TaxID=6216 RepID=A0A564YH16_HYMDI|nr:unnamed protein product [Hymenolepis diminuta]
MTFLDGFLIFKHLCELAEGEESLVLLLSKKADSNSADLTENIGKNSLGIKWPAASIALRQIPAAKEEFTEETVDLPAEPRNLKSVAMTEVFAFQWRKIIGFVCLLLIYF